MKVAPDTAETRKALNRLAREQMKLRLLAEVRIDMQVCELEGWDKLEYLDELLAMLTQLRRMDDVLAMTKKQRKQSLR